MLILVRFIRPAALSLLILILAFASIAAAQQPMETTPADTAPMPNTAPRSASPPPPAPSSKPKTPSGPTPEAREPVDASVDRTIRREPDYTFGSFLLASASLSRAPEMFGDSLQPSIRISATEFATSGFGVTSVTDARLAGGARRAKISENNRALPTDRVYFTYSHFEDVGQTEAIGFAGTPFQVARAQNLDRYLLGLEKTFACGNWSAELRMPLSSTNDFGFTATNVDTSTESGTVGNLALILKRLMYESDTCVVSAGLGIDLPTGDDFHVATTGVRYSIENQAVSLSPFVALMQAPSDVSFWHAFAQLDVPLNGHAVRIESRPPGGPFEIDAGTFNDQTLLYVDVGGGYWLCRNDCDRRPWALAAVLEFHYTSALQDSDVLAATPPTITTSAVDVRTASGRFDVLNFTAGFHADIASRTSLRVAAVAPLADRFFNSELVVQLNRRF